MKKIILALIALVACGMAANAATKYEINVGGTEVTSDNASYITGNDINSGYGVYDASTNTLTLYNITISRTSSGDYALHNRDCKGLKVKFVGTCNLTSVKARAIRFNKSGELVATSGSTVNVTGSNDGAIYFRDFSELYLKGPGTFNIKSTSKKGAIQAHYIDGATVSDLASQDRLVFSDGVNVTIESPESPLYDIWDVAFKESCNVTLKATNNSSYPVVRSVGYIDFYGKTTFLEPFGASFSHDDHSVLNSSGNKIYNQDIYISDNYVAIVNQDYFPDMNFRIEVRNMFPKGYITASDVASTKKITLYNKGISNMEGLQYFTELTELYCHNNKIATLPISALTKLETLNCGYNKITSLTITGRSALKKLYVNDNPITSLNCNNNSLTDLSVMSCSSLTTINCSNNKLTSVNFSWCSALKSLYCQGNQFTTNGLGTLPSSLETLNCSYNKLTSLSLTGRSAFKSLEIANNSDLTKLECQNNSLTTLNVNNCTSMQELNCEFNSLTSLSLYNCTSLKNLYCSANQLTTMPSLPDAIEVVDASDNSFTGAMTITSKSVLKLLNVANSPLTRLECQNNALTALAISGCSELSYLDCSNNKLASLDVRGLKKLATLRAYKNGMTSFYGTYCSALKMLLVCYNNLTSLDLTGCTALHDLWIQKNQIKGAAMTSLINSLRSIPTSESEGMLGVFEPALSLAEGNQITNAQNMAARAKRWIPKQYNNSWQEIPLKGDVNGDGKINVSDVTALINMIMGITTMDAAVADVNGDGKVNVSDVSSLINIILGIG